MDDLCRPQQESFSSLVIQDPSKYYDTQSNGSSKKRKFDVIHEGILLLMYDSRVLRHLTIQIYLL